MENELKNSENYIKSLTGRKTGFSLPDKYFEELENRFPTLLSENNFIKTTSFKTPENYFEGLEDKILTNVLSSEKEVKTLTLSQIILKYTRFVAAASVILFIGITYFSTTNSKEINFDNLADVEIENWLLENSATITAEDIAMVISDKELIENDFTFTNINDDAIEDYMISIDNSSLLNEIN